MPNPFDPMPQDAPPARGNVAEYTVSEISRTLKRTVEDAFGHVRVRGEISGYRGPHGSGHAYFALKDDAASLDAVIWASAMRRLKFKPQEGIEVVAVGRISTYPKTSKYQIVIEQLEPAGVGALMALLEARRKALAAEGLFDESRKRPLPSLPRLIGVITSPTGAVIRDIVHRLEDRFPSRVLVWPVRVQGETSAAEVAAAIEGFNRGAGGLPRPDLLIVARGGGSIEDLWGFNEEIVVRAAAASTIPIIAAVGHETDWTLIDHAADRRAPTPTGAAEFAVPVRGELLTAVDERGARLDRAWRRQAEARRQALSGAERGLPRPASLLDGPRQRLDRASEAAFNALFRRAAGARHRLERSAGKVSAALLQRDLRERRTHLAQRARDLRRTIVDRLGRSAADQDRLARRLRPETLARDLAIHAERLAAATARADRAVHKALEDRRLALASAGQLLAALSYQGVLARGFALVREPSGAPVRAAAGLTSGQPLDVEFADGVVGVVVGDAGRAKAETETADAAPPGAERSPPAEPDAHKGRRARPRPRRREPEGQGSLF